MRLAACFAVAFTIVLMMTACAPKKRMDWMDTAMTGTPYDNTGKILAVNHK